MITGVKSNLNVVHIVPISKIDQNMLHPFIKTIVLKFGRNRLQHFFVVSDNNQLNSKVKSNLSTEQTLSTVCTTPGGFDSSAPYRPFVGTGAMGSSMCKMRVIKYYCNVKVLMGLVPLVIIANTFLYVFFISKSLTKVIPLRDIPNQLVSVPLNLTVVNASKLELCDIMTIAIDGSLNWPLHDVPDVIIDNLPDKFKIEPGGAWRPGSCLSQHHVALIIPYRDRLAHLRDFLAYMHPFLQLQKLDYRIFIIEQTKRRPFNRAKLFNVGFKEAEKISDFHCFIFHDVDLIPQNINNVYGCTQLPRHMSANIDVFEYKIPYDDILGGAVAILKEQFVEVNGFSNSFFGWGGEDDDFFNRVTRNGSRICRFSPSISQYVMLSHKKEKPSDDRYYFLQTGKFRYSTDGLNSLKYTVLQIEMLPLYTRVLVDI